MTVLDFDTAMMQRALSLAAMAKQSTSPNPRVGCVICQGEQIVGEGFHVKAGFGHAEVHALQQAGPLAQGATAYVTLEPCSHHGRTPPCAQALIDAGIAHVHMAMVDPNPQVAGNGVRMLENAGISVSVGLCAKEARELNRGFLSRIERTRPFVKVKIASSLDGKTALANGQSKWITGQEARLDVQHERAISCAVLTGIATILADNPQLNVRLPNTIRQPLRIVLDTHLQMPLDSQIIQDGLPLLIVTQSTNTDKIAALQSIHEHVDILRQTHDSEHIDLPWLMQELALRQIGELMVEAGATLSSAFVAAQLVDEIIYYQAPKILGSGARDALHCTSHNNVLQENSPWHTYSLAIMGQDIKWVLRWQGHRDES